MFNNILNLEGVTVLDKKQQGEIDGGRQNCRITAIGGGLTTVHDYDAPDGVAGSAAANDLCVSFIADVDSVSSCFYDCEYDGYGK